MTRIESAVARTIIDVRQAIKHAGEAKPETPSRTYRLGYAEKLLIADEIYFDADFLAASWRTISNLYRETVR